MYGAELEYRPSPGRIELGILAGVLNYSGGTDPFDTFIEQSKTIGGNVKLHAGLSATWNIIPQLSASLVVRSILPKKEYDRNPYTGQNYYTKSTVWWTYPSFSLAYRF